VSNGQPLLWPAPTERDHRSVYASEATWERNNRRPLSETAGLWATLTVADTEGGRMTRSGLRRDELLLRGQAKQLHSHLDPASGNNGLPSSGSGLILNPLFAENLMNWPPGYSLLAAGLNMPPPSASTGCASSATAWFRWKRRTRSELSRLALQPTFPAQLDLFG
jgi:hypothetical protein